MRKLFASVVFGLMFLAQCGGEDLGTAESASESGTQSSEGFDFTDQAALIPDPLTGAAMGVNAGYASHAEVLTLPTGFTADQCRFTTALATLDSSAISAQASINTETAEVYCQKVVQERVEVPPTFEDCTVSFTVICVQ